MRKGDAAGEIDPPTRARAPGGTGKIAKAVDRDGYRLVERRDMEGRGQVRKMMFNALDRAGKGIGRKRAGDQLGEAGAGAAVAQAAGDQAEPGARGQEKAELAGEIGLAVLIDRDAVDVAQPDAGFSQAVRRRLRRKAGAMLDAAEALFLGGGDQHAVAQQRSRGIGVERIEAEDDHRSRACRRPPAPVTAARRPGSARRAAARARAAPTARARRTDSQSAATAPSR